MDLIFAQKFRWTTVHIPPVSFYVDDSAFGSLSQSTTYHWVEQRRLSQGLSWKSIFGLVNGSKLQNLRTSDTVVEIEGRFQYDTWSRNIVALMALKLIAEVGIPWPVISISGSVMGLFAIVAIEQGLSDDADTRTISKKIKYLNNDGSTEPATESFSESYNITRALKFRIVLKRFSF